MSVKKYRFVSPGVFVSEIDNSQVPASPAGIATPVARPSWRPQPATRGPHQAVCRALAHRLASEVRHPTDTASSYLAACIAACPLARVLAFS